MIFQQVLLIICVLSTKQSESSPLLFGNQDIFTGHLNPRSPTPPAPSSDSHANININFASGGPVSVMEKFMPCKKGCFRTPSMKCKCRPVPDTDYPDLDESTLKNGTLTTSTPLYAEIANEEHANNPNTSSTTQNSLSRSSINMTVITLQDEVTSTTDSFQLPTSTMISALFKNKAESQESSNSASGVEQLYFLMIREIMIFTVALNMLHL